MQPRKYISLVLLAGLAGCASLPTSGPTGKQIEKSVLGPDSMSPIRLVELATIADVPVPVERVPPVGLRADLPPPPTDMIGPGDILDVNIYEAGVTLFSAGAAAAAGEKGGPVTVSTGVQAQKLPPTRVNDDGDIIIPYAGKLHVVGRTVGEVEDMIRSSLRRFSQNPQVIVTLSQVITNSVMVSGEVTRPGRLVLQTNRETLSDVIALAGGYRGNARDLTLRIVRRNENMDLRLNDLVDEPKLDVRAYPGDRLMLINDPRSFSVMGAPGRVEQFPFTRSTTSLAEAIAVAGGVNPGLGDPAAIFVFRYVTDAQGEEVPVVYHLNMMEASAYFLAQRFDIRNKDVIYFGNASANQPSKVLQLISQLFSPLMTVTAAVQTVQNSNN
jgi:polysaccharide export outer membrane protein